MRIGAWLCGLSLLALTACETPQPVEPVPVPPERPETAAPSPPSTEPRPAPPRQSAALRTYYGRLESDLVSQGLLRTDGGGEDTPFTDEMLARNFLRIALYDEYRAEGDDLRPEVTESRLRRWDRPVRMGIEFGASVGAAQREVYRKEISDYANRLSGLTGLPILTDSARPNFHVLVMGEGERQDYGARLRELVPGISKGSVRAFQTTDRSTLCLVLAFSRDDTPVYSSAVALIRAEHPDLLRQSCIHEELAQGLGLANDSPQARPSIFNDDEEFGYLTRHDELLLKILYDPRLEPGMTEDEARPIVRRIAAELVGGES